MMSGEPAASLISMPSTCVQRGIASMPPWLTSLSLFHTRLCSLSLFHTCSLLFLSSTLVFILFLPSLCPFLSTLFCFLFLASAHVPSFLPHTLSLSLSLAVVH